jgi:hypothetical protein
MLRTSFFALAGILLFSSIATAQLQPVDPSDRASVVSFWDNVYAASEGIPAGWTGNVGSCTPGTITTAYKDSGLLRIQYFRAMTGLPTNVFFEAPLDTKCQEPALMMTANGTIDHFPPNTWTCYTVDGDEAAGKSNLAIGFSSLADAVTAWVIDNGINSVGHRRWILYPPQEGMGVGATFGGGSTNAYVLWVFGGTGGFGSRPSSPEWVAWPPEGFVPYQVVPNLWSFSKDGVDFTGATVTMTQGGSNVPVTLEPVQNGFGDNTIVWTPSGLPGGAPSQDTIYNVTVDVIAGGAQSFSYDVTVIDPSVMVPPLPTTWGAIKHKYTTKDDH